MDAVEDLAAWYSIVRLMSMHTLTLLAKNVCIKLMGLAECAKKDAS